MEKEREGGREDGLVKDGGREESEIRNEEKRHTAKAIPSSKPNLKKGTPPSDPRRTDWRKSAEPWNGQAMLIHRETYWYTSLGCRVRSV